MKGCQSPGGSDTEATAPSNNLITKTYIRRGVNPQEAQIPRPVSFSPAQAVSFPSPMGVRSHQKER